eukprot:s1948_g7.t2
MNQANLEKEKEVKKLREDLQYAEERKDHYKNNYSQMEDGYIDEEKAYQAEADAFERLGNEYNKNVKDLQELENEKGKSRISRREADRISLPDWPKVNGVAELKSDVVHDVCIASGDDDWKQWLAPCLIDVPDMNQLMKPPEKKFQSIDAKLAQALKRAIGRAGAKAAGVRSEMKMKMMEYGKHGDFVKGRELFATILTNFKAPDNTEVLYNSHHLYMFQYYGGNQLEAFLMKWKDIIYNMKPDDRPSKNSLRDTLFRKIEDSKLMQYDIHKYKILGEDDPERHMRSSWR